MYIKKCIKLYVLNFSSFGINFKSTILSPSRFFISVTISRRRLVLEFVSIDRIVLMAERSRPLVHYLVNGARMKSERCSLPMSANKKEHSRVEGIVSRSCTVCHKLLLCE